MSIIINNGVANINQTPGIIADVTANFPIVDKIAEGTIYIDTQTLLIYRAQSGGWVQLGGGGGTPTLDQVLTAGNTAINENIILTSSVPGSNITYTSSDVYSCLDSNNTVLMGMRWANIYAENINSNNIVEINFQSDSIIQTEYNNNQIGLKLDFGNNNYEFGIFNNNSILSYSDGLQLNAQLYIYSFKSGFGSIGLSLDFDSNIYSLGDYNQNINATYLQIDDAGQKLILSNNLKSATAGGSAGQHLKINIGGTDYKIALLNP